MADTNEVPTILCTTDLSEASLAGVRMGLRMAADIGGKVEVIHVLDTAPFAHVAGSFLSDSQEHELVAQARERARTELQALCERKRAQVAGVEVTAVLLQAVSAVEAVVDYADKHQVHTIVTATHGRQGTSRFLMGSVSERIVRLAPCPVLVVPRVKDPAA